MSERYQLIAAVYIVLIKDEKILLLQRANTGFEDGNYSLPAGHLLPGEAVRDGAIREAMEEVAVILESEDLSVVHTLVRKKKSTDPDMLDRVDFFVEAKHWAGEPMNAEPHVCDNIAWFPLEQLPENTIPYIRQAIDCIRRRQPFSEFGWS